MALRCAGKRLSHRAVPPGLLRLGLSPEFLNDVGRTAESAGPAEVISRLVQKGALQDDPGQRRAVVPLNACWRSVKKQEEEYPVWEKNISAWEAECAKLKAQHEDRQRQRREENEKGRSKTPQEARQEDVLVLPQAPVAPLLDTPGCYIYGEVGRGKTLLMDIFAMCFKPPAKLTELQEGAVVRRAHFHDFMYTLHRRINESRREGARAGLDAAVKDVASGTPAVLCFDEFQITNIADATLITSFFQQLFQREVAMVATSNRPPKHLFQNGLARDMIMPRFVASMEKRLDIHYLDAPLDYRELRSREEMKSSVDRLASDFFSMAEATRADGEGHLSGAFSAAAQGTAPGSKRLALAWGRQVECATVGGGAVRFTFGEICDRPYSAEDYSALVTQGHIHTFVVSDVPVFKTKMHNQARRFTNLIDTLYEHQCRLVFTCNAPLEKLLAGINSLCTIEESEGLSDRRPVSDSRDNVVMKKHHGDITFPVSDNSHSRPDTFATAEADAEAGTSIPPAPHFGTVGADSSNSGGESFAGALAIAADSLRESGFASRRCLSRLREMNTNAYRVAHTARWLSTAKSESV